MNWIRENKFLAAFLGFVVAGAGALTFFLVQAVGHYGEVNDAYTTKVDQLKGLQSLPTFPNAQNLEKYKEESTAFTAAVSALQQDLATHEFPLVPMSPEQFQDKLRTTVDAVAQKAKDGKITLPAKFALGFDRYLTETPGKDAAAPLGRQLTAIEFIVNELLDSRVESITSINRAPLPEESGKKPSTASVVAHPFEINFVSEQGRFRKILNDTVSNIKQLYVVRLIQIKNQEEKSPPKVAVAAAAPAVPGSPVADAGLVPAPAAPSTNTRLKYIFGTEKLIVTMKLEVIDFVSPPAK